MIYTLIGVDIVRDDTCIHPAKICDKCYQHVTNSYKSGVQGQYCHEMDLGGVYGTLKGKVQDTCNVLKPMQPLDALFVKFVKPSESGG